MLGTKREVTYDNRLLLRHPCAISGNLEPRHRRQITEFRLHIAHASLAEIENGKWPPTLHGLYTRSVIYARDYLRLASVCGVPTSEALKEHQKLHLPSTYLIGPTLESNKSIIASAAELREKLRAERTNLVPKMLEA